MLTRGSVPLLYAGKLTTLKVAPIVQVLSVEKLIISRTTGKDWAELSQAERRQITNNYGVLTPEGYAYFLISISDGDFVLKDVVLTNNLAHLVERRCIKVNTVVCLERIVKNTCCAHSNPRNGQNLVIIGMSVVNQRVYKTFGTSQLITRQNYKAGGIMKEMASCVSSTVHLRTDQGVQGIWYESFLEIISPFLICWRFIWAYLTIAAGHFMLMLVCLVKKLVMLLSMITMPVWQSILEVYQDALLLRECMLDFKLLRKACAAQPSPNKATNSNPEPSTVIKSIAYSSDWEKTCPTPSCEELSVSTTSCIILEHSSPPETSYSTQTQTTGLANSSACQKTKKEKKKIRKKKVEAPRVISEWDDVE